MGRPARNDTRGSAASSGQGRAVLTSPVAGRVGLLALVVLAGTWLSTIFHYVQGFYLGLPYPYNSFLFIPSDHFMDFFNDYKAAQQYLAGTSSTITYTPFAHTVMSLLTLMPKWWAFGLIASVFVCTMVFMLGRFYVSDPGTPLATRLGQLFVLLAMSYPVLFALDRGNQEMLVFVLLFWFFYFYFVKRRTWLGVAFLTAAIAMKIYPAVFLVLLIADRRFREAACGVVGTALAWLGGAMVVGQWSGRGTVAVLRSTVDTLAGGHGTYMLGMEAVGHRNSLWNVTVLMQNISATADRIPGLVRPYAAFALLLFVVLSAYVVFVEREPWRRVALLTVAMLLLPYLTGAYNLIHLFLPIMLFVNTGRSGRFDRTYAILFGLLLVPLDYLIIISDTSSATLLVPLIMGLLVLLLLVDRLWSTAPAAGTATTLPAIPR
jgi:hypothetical protein